LRLRIARSTSFEALREYRRAMVQSFVRSNVPPRRPAGAPRPGLFRADWK
jgi:hypothetical protein